MNELAILGQVTDERMLGHEVELLLLVAVASQQGAYGAQVIGTRSGRQLTGALQRSARVALGQAEQALQHTHAFDAAHRNDRFAPARAVRTQTSCLPQ